MQTSSLQKLVLRLILIAIACGLASPVILYVGMRYGGIGGHGGDWTVWLAGLCAFFTSWFVMAASVAISFVGITKGIPMRWWSVVATGLLIGMSILGVWGLGG